MTSGVFPTYTPPIAHYVAGVQRSEHARKAHITPAERLPGVFYRFYLGQ